MKRFTLILLAALMLLTLASCGANDKYAKYAGLFACLDGALGEPFGVALAATEIDQLGIGSHHEAGFPFSRLLKSRRRRILRRDAVSLSFPEMREAL